MLSSRPRWALQNQGYAKSTQGHSNIKATSGWSKVKATSGLSKVKATRGQTKVKAENAWSKVKAIFDLLIGEAGYMLVSVICHVYIDSYNVSYLFHRYTQRE